MGGVTIVWHTGIFSTQRADDAPWTSTSSIPLNERKQIYCNLVVNLSWCPNVPKTGTYLQVAWDLGLELMTPNMARHGNRCPTLTLILQEADNIDLEFVKKFTRPNFRAKEFYTLKTPKLRLFSPPVNSKNASSSVIWPSFGSKSTKCVNSLTVVKEVYI